MTHPLAALIAGVKVKPLVWTNDGVGIWRAVDSLGAYYEVNQSDAQLQLNLVARLGAAHVGQYPTLEAAKAAAQADYEARILAALEAAPVPDLVEAGKALDRTNNTAIDLSDQNLSTEAIAVSKACDTIRTLIALATAQAAQIAGLKAERDRFETALARCCLVGGQTYYMERIDLAERRAEAVGAKVAELEAHIEGVAKDTHKLLVAAEAETATLRDEVERLQGLLCLADEALMQSHGCFPLDRTNERQIFLNDACTAIRRVTGDDYAERKRRARAALEGKHD